MIVFDSYAWIEYFLGSDSGRIVKDYIDMEEAVTPSIVLAEVARKYLREGMKEASSQIHTFAVKPRKRFSEQGKAMMRLPFSK